MFPRLRRFTILLWPRLVRRRREFVADFERESSGVKNEFKSDPDIWALPTVWQAQESPQVVAVNEWAETKRSGA
jgi:hypothetical protein